MIGRTGMRGQPLLLFGAILTGWLALRIAVWESPFVPRLEPSEPGSRLAAVAVAAALPARRHRAGAAPTAYTVPARGGLALERSGPAHAVARQAVLSPAWATPPVMQTGPSPVVQAPLKQLQAPIGPRNHLVAEDLLRRQAPTAGLGDRQGVTRLPRRDAAPVPRWSADGWFFLRRNGSPWAALSERPSYGRSQMGAVVRYALAPGWLARPRAHVRTAATLSGPREREFAAGLSVRPLSDVPLRVAVEARASESAAGTRVRPAAYAVTEFPPRELPLGVRAEAYVQGGYVGGDFATAFVDGQARAERSLARVGKTELTAGAGAWGGAQKGSSRLDAGPTTAIEFQLGKTRGRLAAAYRFRVSGNAEPASGPALTLSAGF